MLKSGKITCFVAVFLACGACALATACSQLLEGESASSDLSVSSDLVIAQVFGGGGNSGAPFSNDFVEIKNRGQSPVNLGGKSLQYAGFNKPFTADNRLVDLPSFELKPGQSFLVQLAAGGEIGKALPNPDFVAPPVAGDAGKGTFNLSKDNGKVALVPSDAPLKDCGTPEAQCAAESFLDLVGFGTATQAEGKPTPALGNAMSAQRKGNGCRDTGNNVADFVVAAVAPRASDAPFVACDADAGEEDDAGAGSDADIEASSDAQSTDGSPPDATPIEPGKGLVLLNELKINPPGKSGTPDTPWEYIELLCEKGEPLAGYSFIAVEGDGKSGPGLADIVVDLSPFNCGGNGLALIKAPTGGHVAQKSDTTIIPAPALESGPGLENATTAFILVRSTSAPIAVGTDLDPDNDGKLDLPAGVTLVDGVATYLAPDGGVNHTYVPEMEMGKDAPDAVMRSAGDNTPLSAAAWYGGDLTGDTPDGLQFNTTRVMPGFPKGATLTPGEVNLKAAPVDPNNPGGPGRPDYSEDDDDVPSGPPTTFSGSPKRTHAGSADCSASPRDARGMSWLGFLGMAGALAAISRRRRRSV